MRVIVNETKQVINVGVSSGGSGVPGPAGNGIESITLINTVGLVKTYQILFTNGDTFNYNVSDGEDGDTGNGIESIELFNTSGLVKTYRITFTDSSTFDFDVSDGQDGDDGSSAYVYIAYASDDSGTDFTTIFDPTLDYIAILSTDTEILTPVVGDFTGLWKNYKGQDGSDATATTDASLLISGTLPDARLSSNVLKMITPSGGDDVALIEAAISTGPNTFLGTGTFLISRDISIPSNKDIWGNKGTVIKAMETRTGQLETNGRYIHFPSTTSNSSIAGVTFQPANNMINIDGFGKSVIRIEGADNEVRNCRFEFSQDYGFGYNSVYISGTSANRNKILDNKVYTLSMTYTESGACDNEVRRNYIFNPSGDGLSGVGNQAEGYSTGNKVIGNYVFDAGRMGIEDQQKTSGTIIEKNHIYGSGKHFGAGFRMGISAVGKATRVLNNYVTDFGDYGIELTNEGGQICCFNEVDNISGEFTGIGINAVSEVTDVNYIGSLVSKNIVKNCDFGISYFGEYADMGTISENEIINAYGVGINIDSSNNDLTIDVLHNRLIFDVQKNSGTRTAIKTFSGGVSSSNNISIIGNKIKYLTGLNGQSSFEIGINTANDNTLIEANMVRSKTTATIYSYADNGASNAGLIFQNNKNFGGIVSLGNYVTPVLLNNNW